MQNQSPQEHTVNRSNKEMEPDGVGEQEEKRVWESLSNVRIGFLPYSYDFRILSSKILYQKCPHYQPISLLTSINK